jgi:hypothetical protein
MTKNMGTADCLIPRADRQLVPSLPRLERHSWDPCLLGIVAVAFLVTSLVGWCPSYLPFGLSTRKAGEGPENVGAPR